MANTTEPWPRLWPPATLSFKLSCLEDKRGRVMSYYTMAFVGMAPFGSLLAGSLAHRFGAPHAIIITGSFCIAGALWFSTRLKSIRAIIRPIYIEMVIVQSPLEPAMEDNAGGN